MHYRELNRGDRGEDVQQLQTLLNRIGAMLKADGAFGRQTEYGVRYAQKLADLPATGTAEVTLWPWLESQPVPYPPLATDGVAFIAQEETGGIEFYEKYTKWPHHPSAGSGITIGIGYDLQFQKEIPFRDFWGPYLPPATIEALCEDLGVRGSRKRVAELKNMGIEIPFYAAWRVFVEHILPTYHYGTVEIYPSVPRLPDMCRSVLVSIVYNRGKRLNGSRRREMKAIQRILDAADNPELHKPKRKMILSEVEEQILSMRRLWKPQSGLFHRRQKEANLWREALNAW